jgi:hypothetical protein
LVALEEASFPSGYHVVQRSMNFKNKKKAFHTNKIEGSHPSNGHDHYVREDVPTMASEAIAMEHPLLYSYLRKSKHISGSS